MKARISVFSNIYNDMTLSQLVSHIIKLEDGYFLDYDDEDSMVTEFIECAENYVTDEDLEYLQNNHDEVKTALIEAREFINKENFDDFVDESANFMRDTWEADFSDYANNPVFGEAKERAFKEAVKLLYNNYCVNS